jgi:exonuclease III
MLAKTGIIRCCGHSETHHVDLPLVLHLARGRQPEETRREYLPNGNPAPGPKFDYKLNWLARLAKYAKKLLILDKAVVLAGDYNVIPTEFDTYKPERWVDDALFFPESRAAYQKLLSQGWTDAIRKLYPDEAIYSSASLRRMAQIIESEK